MRKSLVLVLCAAIATSGCAAAARTHQPGRAPAPPPTSGFDPAVMADYIRQLPVGSHVRVTLAGGSVIHATLMRRDTDPIVVQRRTRIPEPPIELAVRDIRALEIETGTSNPGRVVAITAAAAAGATLGVLLVLAAIFSD
jgi:hypothetical protein